MGAGEQMKGSGRCGLEGRLLHSLWGLPAPSELGKTLIFFFASVPLYSLGMTLLLALSLLRSQLLHLSSVFCSLPGSPSVSPYCASVLHVCTPAFSPFCPSLRLPDLCWSRPCGSLTPITSPWGQQSAVVHDTKGPIGHYSPAQGPCELSHSLATPWFRLEVQEPLALEGSW